jgi:hypothetical protein
MKTKIKYLLKIKCTLTLTILMLVIYASMNAAPLVLQLTASSYNGYNVSCFGGSDGSIDLTVTGGTPPYSYLWSTGSLLEDINSLAANYYSVEVSDAGSNKLTMGITLTEPSALVISGSLNEYANGYHISCYQCSNGIVAINMSGGVSPYSYLWNDDNPSQVHYSMGAGTYSVSVTDANGCTISSEHYYLTEPPKSNWAMDGNSDSNPPTQFIGTSDNKDVVLKANNIERLRLGTNGKLTIKDTLKLSAYAGDTVPRLLFVNPDGNIYRQGQNNIVIPCASLSQWYEGNTANDVVLCGTQKVGIGTSSPNDRLEVNGIGRFTAANTSNDNISIRHDGTGGNGDARIDNHGSGNLLINCNNNKDVQICTGNSGNVSIGNSNKIVRMDGKVGIGTNPLYKFHIKGNTSTDAVLFVEAGDWNSLGDICELRLGDGDHYMRAEHSRGMTIYDINQIGLMGGNVGIGTASPLDKFQVNDGPIKLNIGDASGGGNQGQDLSYGNAYIGFNAARNKTSTGDWTFNTDNQHNGGSVIWSDVNGNIYFSGLQSTEPPALQNQTLHDADIKNHIAVKINSDGRMGIGVTDFPTFDLNTYPYKLYVTGGIMTEKVMVALKGGPQWADHVFQKDYCLRTVAETERYINENGHLPDVPSADELCKSGLDIAEMQKIQMQKIEEMMLYIIELKKENEQLKILVQKK